MKKVFTVIVQYIKNLLLKNWGMKLGALAFALLLWTFVMAETNPPREKEFKNIPVSFVNVEAMKQKSLTTQKSLQEIIKTASVTVKAEARALQYISESMITVTVDLATVNDVGEYTLPVDAVCSLGAVVSVNPSEVTCIIEEIVEREVPVEVNVAGKKEDWLYYGDPVMSQNTVTIKGGRTLVEQVSKAVLDVDVTGMELPIKESMQVSLVDNKGNTMDAKQFFGLPTVIVEMPVYPKKSVPIDMENIKENITGIMQGYEVTEVTIDPANIEIAGKIENINSVNKVSLEPIDLGQATSDITVISKVILPEGIIAVVPKEVQIQVKITQPEEKRTYYASDVAVKNLDKTLKADLNPYSIDINVFGTQEKFADFSASKLKPFVDCQGLKEGVYQLPVKFENEPDIAVRIVPAVTKIEVIIT